VSCAVVVVVVFLVLLFFLQTLLILLLCFFFVSSSIFFYLLQLLSLHLSSLSLLSSRHPPLTAWTTPVTVLLKTP
jgi:hypothetical protein